VKSQYSKIRGVGLLVAAISISGCVSNVCGNAGKLDPDAEIYCENQTAQANYEKGQRIGLAMRKATAEVADVFLVVLEAALTGAASIPSAPASAAIPPEQAPMFPPAQVQPAQVEAEPIRSILPPPVPPIQVPEYHGT
jgi:hypothetical protein